MMISRFFSYLFFSSVSGSIVVALIMLIRILFKNKLGSRWNYYIWFILVFKLVFPYFPEGPLNIYEFIEKMIICITKNAQYTLNTKLINQGTSEVSLFADSTKDYAVSVSKGVINDKYVMLYIAWAIIFFLCLFIIVLNNIKLKTAIKTKSEVKEKDINVLLQSCKNELNINQKIKMVRIEKDRYPALFGFINPCILMPQDIENKITNDELRYILLHELAHYKRKDMFVALIISILQLIYWFNPIIYYAFYLMKKDMEIACDGYVLSKISKDEVKSYGFTIVKLLEISIYNKKTTATLGIMKNKKSAKNRIKMIAEFKKESKIKVMINSVVFIFVGSILLSCTQGTALANEKSIINKDVKYEEFNEFYGGFEGSFVLYDVNKDKYEIYNRSKSEERVSPCSTYKIIDALIGLETYAIKDEKENFKWDGTEYPYEEWNKDQNLNSAMKNSVNWYFEQVDKNIDKNTLKYYLNRLEYGNKDINSFGNDYWLQDSLKISPIEQVEILKKLLNYELPFSKVNIDRVKNSIILMKNSDTVLYGKTGSGVENNKSVNGWFVGFIEKNDEKFIFTCNIEASDGATGTKAKEIAMKILKQQEGIIE